MNEGLKADRSNFMTSTSILRRFKLAVKLCNYVDDSSGKMLLARL